LVDGDNSHTVGAGLEKFDLEKEHRGSKSVS